MSNTLETPSRSPGSIGPMIPIGTIRTPFIEAVGTPIQGGLSEDAVGEVVLDPAYLQGLEDLAGFSHLILVYVFHRMKGFELSVKPYLDTKQRGIFATRSPCRPNPIGLTIVRLNEVDGCRLKVSGVDMLDETPLLDIKPSIPAFDHYSCSSVRCGWFEPHLKHLEQTGAVPVADDRFHSDDGE